MPKANDGDIVKVHYTGWLEDGSRFDSSRDREPLEFQIGKGQVIQGVDRAVVGMAVGEMKKLKVPAAEAYGLYRDDMVGDIPRDQFPGGLELQAGQQLQVRHGEDQRSVITVLEVGENTVKIDMNHPLAGEDLTFELEVVAIGADAG